MAPQCSKCDHDAVYLRRYTAEKLCASCLIHTSVDQVRRTINRLKMFRDDDRIVVGISGGKDSAVLLDILFQIEERYPKAEIIPVTIDEGIRGYRDEALKAAEQLSSSLGLQLEIRSFKELFGMTLDAMVNMHKTDNRLGACSYCGVFRRKALNLTARELDADVVTTGHNMDDEAQTILMNILRGDGKRIARTNRLRTHTIQGFIPRVKPLMELSERDVVAYAYYKQLPYHDVPCPYAVEAYRNDVRDFLKSMEYKRPGTLRAVLRSGEGIASAMINGMRTHKQTVCSNCGDPSPTRLCKACQFLQDLDLS